MGDSVQRTSFVLHLDTLAVLDELTDEQAGQFIKAIYTHRKGGEISADPLMRALLVPFIAQMKRDDEKYAKKVSANRNNGLRGGRPKANETQENPVGFSGTQHKPNESQKTREGEGEGEGEREGEREKEKNTPLTPQGETPADAGHVTAEAVPMKTKKQAVDYQGVADAYNEVLSDKLPSCKSINEKRRRAISKLLAELSEPTVEKAASYFRAFAKQARPFHFGENDRGWRADFDYVIRTDTLLKTREGAL